MRAFLENSVSRLQRACLGGINQLNYKLLYRSWAKRPPVEDRTRKVGWRDEVG